MVLEDLSKCELQGVQVEGGDVNFPVVLGNKGDWSYLVPWLHGSVVKDASPEK